jgi:signal transduction histidine kinase
MATGTLLAIALALGLAAAAALVLLARARAARRRAEGERDAASRRLAALGRDREAERARLLETARAAREEAERAGRARHDLVAMVSHELRTPLNAVLGWARLLRSGRLDAAGVARAAETIERSASAQAQIVDDLLDVARIAKGELRLDVRTVELVPVLEAAVAAVRPAAAARKLAIATMLASGVGPVSGDPGRLQQVVWNLLANAVKFTPPGGRVEVRLLDGGDAAIIEVRDTGEGIAPEFVPHLFESFRQADSSSTRPHGGLGLGLAIVRHLVEAHGGSVSAESEGRGRGATFTVRLPVSDRLRAGAGGPRAPAVASAPTVHA